MTLALVIHVLWTSALLTVGATLAARLLQPLRMPVRMVWAAALLLVVAIPAAALLRPAASYGPAPAPELVGDVTSLGTFIASTPASMTAGAIAALPAWSGHLLAVLWMASSATALLLLAAMYVRHRTRLRRADTAIVEGVRVRLMDGFGPAVVGVHRPEIVLPRWLLTRDARAQAMVIAHERSHVTARDPLLLLAGCAAVAAMPWNPFAWHLLGRLRLAIELDCDLRVLRAGVTAGSYGALLIDLTAALPRAGLATPAFAYRPSDLERRLRAMTTRPVSHRTVRTAAALSLGTMIGLAACGAEIPTAPQIEAMGVAEVERRVSVVSAIDISGATHVVDGVIVSREVAEAIAPERIRSVQIARAEDGRVPRIHITTIDVEPGAIPVERPVILPSLDEAATAQRERRVRLMEQQVRDADEHPLLVVDGVIRVPTDLKEMRPEEIERIEVVKGQAARQVYGERGRFGVILVKTRK